MHNQIRSADISYDSITHEYMFQMRTKHMVSNNNIIIIEHTY